MKLQLSASAIRWALNAAGSILLAHGYFVSSDQASEVIGAIASLAAFGWGMYTHNANVLVPKDRIATPIDPKVPPY